MYEDWCLWLRCYPPRISRGIQVTVFRAIARSPRSTTEILNHRLRMPDIGGDNGHNGRGGRWLDFDQIGMPQAELERRFGRTFSARAAGCLPLYG